MAVFRRVLQDRARVRFHLGEHAGLLVIGSEHLVAAAQCGERLLGRVGGIRAARNSGRRRTLGALGQEAGFGELCAEFADFPLRVLELRV